MSVSTTYAPTATFVDLVSGPRPAFEHIQFQSDAARAERLKVLGNEFYRRGEYKQALDKYGEALKKDRINAVIYANRAAVYLAMKEHVDAVFDCEKATSIDPHYAKGWARLGTALYALSSWDECINAWQKALKCLSKPSLTQPEIALKTQIELGLDKARHGSAQNAQSRSLAPALHAPSSAWMESPAAPWNRAAALHRDKENALADAAGSGNPRAPSCVLALSYANAYFNDAMNRLNALVSGGMSANATRWAGGGIPGFFDSMTSAILIDERVFRVKNPQLFYARVVRQYEFETTLGDGLVEGGGVENIKKEVLKRLQELGWEKVQHTIQITVRYWIFQAFWRHYLYGPTFLSYKLYTRALEFIEWGRSQWPDVPHSVCGSSFQKEIIRGLKRVRIQHMQMLLDTKQPDEVEHLFTLRELLTAADDLLSDVEGHNMDEIKRGSAPIGHLLAFWITPGLHASHVKAFVYYSLGQAWSAMPDCEYKGRVHDAYAQSNRSYNEAIALCPDDDPNLALLLRKQLECMSYSFRPLRERLAVCEAIRKATPIALDIWSPPDERGVALIQNLAEVEQFDDWCKKEVADGKMGMDDEDRWYRPMPVVYDDLSQADDPFQPRVFTRVRENGELTDRCIFLEPPRPPKLAGPSQKN